MRATDQRTGGRFATAAMIALAMFAAWRIGVFDPWTTVAGSAGQVSIPNALAGVDHPFHIARAELLRRSWSAGEPLRWVGSHQQGYPAEFYPFGAQALTVAFWVAAFGRLPIGWAHSAMVAVVFALPGLGFWLAAKRDRLPTTVALLAFAGQVVIPGAWWHGGYTELVQWGLVTNVAGAVWQLLALVWLTGWARTGNRVDGALAIAAGSVALLTNPRSSFALAAMFGGVLLAALLPARWPVPLGALLLRLTLSGAGMALLAAPELLSLARFSRYYEFLHYSGYETIGEWLASAATAVWLPIALLSAVGLAVAVGAPVTTRPLAPGGSPDALPTSRAMAFTLLLYSLLTAAAILLPETISQLEATRLMPFQRSLMFWLGAIGAWWIVGALARTRRWAAEIATAVLVVLAAAVVLFWLRPGGAAIPLPGPPEAPDRGLYAVARSGVSSQVDLEAAVIAADAAAPPGTAILVLGSNLSWHQQLWAPLWSDRPFLYDNWLWFWRSNHDGPPGYAFAGGHSYPKPQLALDASYLRAHGIGAVVATAEFANAAARRPWLQPVANADAAYRTWTVTDANPLVTSGDFVPAADVTYRNGHIDAVMRHDGRATVAQAWFPRWQATIGGSPAPVVSDTAGMLRTEPLLAGSGLSLRYETDLLDWLARALSGCGALLAIGLLCLRRDARHRAIGGGGVSS